MARRATPKPFDSSRLKHLTYNAKYSKADIPTALARGLVRGLMHYFSIPSRLKILDRVSLDVLEDCLIAHAKRTFTKKKALTDEDVNQIADAVPEIMRTLLQHPSKDVLREEFNRLLSALSSYQGQKDVKARTKWLQMNLPSVLTTLLQKSRCTSMDCPRRKDLPDEAILKDWAHSASGVVELLRHLLAYHHASTPSAVADRLDREAPKRARRLSL